MRTKSTARAIVLILLTHFIFGIAAIAQVGAATEIPISFDIEGNANRYAPALLAVSIAPLCFAFAAFLITRQQKTTNPSTAKQNVLGLALSGGVTIGSQLVICLNAG